MTEKKTALISGISGQDGSYLGELLLQSGYRVVGLCRDAAAVRARLPATLAAGISLETLDLREPVQLRELFSRYGPDEIYHLASLARGVGMFEKPVEIGHVNGLATTHFLEAIRVESPTTRFCQASSSEIFGQPLAAPQDENAVCRPRSPYGAAKLYAHVMTGIYRNTYGVHASSAILFNHESPRRGSEFVSRRVSRAAASIKLGLSDRLLLGNLDARRDWGFAGDYVAAMHAMLQQEQGDDYVIATGTTHSVRELCNVAFSHLGLDYRDFVATDPAAYRADEPVALVGDPGKARAVLGWSPKVSFEELVVAMVDHDLEDLRRGEPH